MWAVLTTDGKEHGRWSAEDFFATGRAEIAMILARAAAHGTSVRAGRALDFGCGVGRLSQALAEHFASVDGVDIAPSMLNAARRLDHHQGKVSYRLNTEPDLRLFAGGTFDFVYSTLVLQHMAPENALRYIAEFCRVLSPGGVAVFQLPSDQAAADSPTDAVRTTAGGPIPLAQRRARVRAAAPDGVLRPGARFTLEVAVTNLGDSPWPCLGRPDDTLAVVVGGRYLDTWRRPVPEDAARAPLPHDLRPGETVRVFTSMLAPRRSGAHLLQLDVLQEGVAWFGECGSQAAEIGIVVVGGDDGGSGGDQRADAERRPPLRVSHPALHKLLFGDALRRFAATHLARAAHFLSQRRNARRRRAAAGPIMEMHNVPRAQVETVVQVAGARMLRVDTDVLAGGLRSRRYWVTK